MTLNAYLNRFRSVKRSNCANVIECLQHFHGLVPSVASILTKQYSLRGGKYLVKTPENAISETQKTQNVPRCLSPQELVPLVQVSKPSTIHYQPAT